MSLDVVAKRAIARREARSVRVQTGVPVAPRDGTTLRADVNSPVAGGPHHNTGNDWQEAELRTVRQRVFHDANRASGVHFPTILS